MNSQDTNGAGAGGKEPSKKSGYFSLKPPAGIGYDERSGFYVIGPNGKGPRRSGGSRGASRGGAPRPSTRTGSSTGSTGHARSYSSRSAHSTSARGASSYGSHSHGVGSQRSSHSVRPYSSSARTPAPSTTSSYGTSYGASQSAPARSYSSRPSSGGYRGGSSNSSHSSYSSNSGRSGGYSSHSSRGGRFGGSRGGGRGRGRRGFAPAHDISKFINIPVEDPAGEEKYVSDHTFATFGLNEKLVANITSKGYVHPTPIQDKAIPVVMQGKDIVGIANTGTGKTAAFLLPIIHKILTEPETKALIIAPTRELASQINKEFTSFTQKMGLWSVCCVGGEWARKQTAELRLRHHVVVGTPGRIIDLAEKGVLKLEKMSIIVLDEADRMLDMGFIDDMRKIMTMMPKPRQTLLFSATLSREIEGIIHQFLTNPVSVSVKVRETSKNVHQDVVRVPFNVSKVDVLCDLLAKPEFSRVLIFVETKIGVDRLATELKARGIAAELIHGDREHRERKRSLMNFKEGKVKVLVATDVAARGLDIDDITHVINYDMPLHYEDYVHRIGRTGRGSKKGKALTFVEHGYGGR